MASVLARLAMASTRATSAAATASTSSLLRAFCALPKLQQVSIARYVVSCSKLPASTRWYAAHETRATRTATKKVTKKTAVKKKVVAKKKKAAPKKPKMAVKKVILTPKQKQAKAIKELKALVLKSPKSLPQTAWQLFVAKHNKTVPIDKTLGPRFKELSPLEREQLNEEVVANKHANEKAYETWLKSHTPEEVWRSNKAVGRLRAIRKKEKLNFHLPRSISDTRQIKRPANSYSLFYKDKVDSGVMQGLSVSETAKLVSQQWREASPLEKQRYKDLAAASSLKYKQEAERIYGHIPTLRGGK